MNSITFVDTALTNSKTEFSIQVMRTSISSFAVKYSYPLSIRTLDPKDPSPSLSQSRDQTFSYLFDEGSMGGNAAVHELLRHYTLCTAHEYCSRVLQSEGFQVPEPTKCFMAGIDDRAFQPFCPPELARLTPDIVFLVEIPGLNKWALLVVDVTTFAKKDAVQSKFTTYSGFYGMSGKVIAGKEIAWVSLSVVAHSGIMGSTARIYLSHDRPPLPPGHFEPLANMIDRMVKFMMTVEAFKQNSPDADRTLQEFLSEFKKIPIEPDGDHSYYFTEECFRRLQGEPAVSPEKICSEVFVEGIRSYQKFKRDYSVESQKRSIRNFIDSFGMGFENEPKPSRNCYCKCPLFRRCIRSRREENSHVLSKCSTGEILHDEDLQRELPQSVWHQIKSEEEDDSQRGSWRSGFYMVQDCGNSRKFKFFKEPEADGDYVYTSESDADSHIRRWIQDHFYYFSGSQKEIPREAEDLTGLDGEDNVRDRTGVADERPADFINGEEQDDKDGSSNDPRSFELGRKDGPFERKISDSEGAESIFKDESINDFVGRQRDLVRNDFVTQLLRYFLARPPMKYGELDVRSKAEILEAEKNWSPKGTINEVKHQNYLKDFWKEMQRVPGMIQYLISRGLKKEETGDEDDPQERMGSFRFDVDTSDMECILKTMSALFSDESSGPVKIDALDLVDKASRDSGGKGLHPNLKRIISSSMGQSMLLLQEIYHEISTKSNAYASDGLSYTSMDLSWMPDHEGREIRVVVRPVEPGKNLSYMIMTKGFMLQPFGKFCPPMNVCEDGWYATQFETISPLRLSIYATCFTTILKVFVAWKMDQQTSFEELKKIDFDFLALSTVTVLCGNYHTSQILMNTKYQAMTSLGMFNPIVPILSKFPCHTHHLFTMFILRRVLQAMMSEIHSIETGHKIEALNRDFKTVGVYSWMFPNTEVDNLGIFYIGAYLGGLYDARNDDFRYANTAIYEPVLESEDVRPSADEVQKMLNEDTRHKPGTWHVMSRTYMKFIADCLRESDLPLEDKDYSMKILTRFYELSSEFWSYYATDHASLSEDGFKSIKCYQAVVNTMDDPLWKGVRQPCLYPEKLYQSQPTEPVVAIRRKPQMLGTREIFLLIMGERLGVCPCESYSRSVNECITSEMLSKGDRKVQIVSNLVPEIALEIGRKMKKGDKIVYRTVVTDCSKWATNFMTSFMAFFHARLVRNSDLEGPCRYLISMLNRWTNEKLSIDPSIVEKILKCPTMHSRSPSLEKLFQEVRGEVKRELTDDESRFIKLVCGFNQGIFHFTSSSLHAAVYTAFQKLLEPFGVIVSRSLVSSDDGCLVFAFIDKKIKVSILKELFEKGVKSLSEFGFEPPEFPWNDEEEIMLSEFIDVMLCGLDFMMVNCNMLANWKKMALCIPDPVFEFNTIYVKNQSTFQPAISVMLGESGGKADMNPMSCMQNDAGIRQELLARGMTLDLLNVYQQIQAFCFYLQQGELINGSVKRLHNIFYSRPFMQFGYYPLERPEHIGAMGWKWLLRQNMKLASNEWKYIYYQLSYDGIDVNRDNFSILKFLPPSVKKYDDFTSRTRNWPSREDIIEILKHHPEVIYRPQSLEDVRNSIMYKTAKSVTAGATFDSKIRAISASVYLPIAPLMKIKCMSPLSLAKFRSIGVLDLPGSGSESLRCSMLALAVSKWDVPAFSPFYETILEELDDELSVIDEAYKRFSQDDLTFKFEPNTKRYLTVSQVSKDEEIKIPLATTCLERWGVTLPKHFTSDIESAFLGYQLRYSWLKTTMRATAETLNVSELSLVEFLMSLSSKKHYWRVMIHTNPSPSLISVDRLVDVMSLASNVTHTRRVVDFKKPEFKFMVDNIQVLTMNDDNAMRELHAKASLIPVNPDSLYTSSSLKFLNILQSPTPVLTLLQTTKSYIEKSFTSTAAGSPGGSSTSYHCLSSKFYILITREYVTLRSKQTGKTRLKAIYHISKTSNAPISLVQSLRSRLRGNEDVSEDDFQPDIRFFNLEQVCFQQIEMFGIHLAPDWTSGLLHLRLLDKDGNRAGRVSLEPIPWSYISDEPNYPEGSALGKIQRNQILNEDDLNSLLGSAEVPQGRENVKRFALANIMIQLQTNFSTDPKVQTYRLGSFRFVHSAPEADLDDDIADEDVSSELGLAGHSINRLQNGATKLSEFFMGFEEPSRTEIEAYIESNMPELPVEEKAALASMIEELKVTRSGLINGSLIPLSDALKTDIKISNSIYVKRQEKEPPKWFMLHAVSSLSSHLPLKDVLKRFTVMEASPSLLTKVTKSFLSIFNSPQTHLISDRLIRTHHLSEKDRLTIFQSRLRLLKMSPKECQHAEFYCKNSPGWIFLTADLNVKINLTYCLQGFFTNANQTEKEITMSTLIYYMLLSYKCSRPLEEIHLIVKRHFSDLWHNPCQGHALFGVLSKEKDKEILASYKPILDAIKQDDVIVEMSEQGSMTDEQKSIKSIIEEEAVPYSEDEDPEDLYWQEEFAASKTVQEMAEVIDVELDRYLPFVADFNDELKESKGINSDPSDKRYLTSVLLIVCQDKMSLDKFLQVLTNNRRLRNNFFASAAEMYPSGDYKNEENCKILLKYSTDLRVLENTSNGKPNIHDQNEFPSLN